jgi:PadR family transcriptional regulator PadR
MRSGRPIRPGGLPGRRVAIMDAEFGSFETEMNRGYLQVLVLVALERKMYGYGMIRLFEQTGYAVEENTLYPLLRRLEKNGWIKGEWDVGEDRPKKYYRITESGASVRERALAIWAEQNDVLMKMKEDSRHV